MKLKDFVRLLGGALFSTGVIIYGLVIHNYQMTGVGGIYLIATVVPMVIGIIKAKRDSK